MVNEFVAKLLPVDFHVRMACNRFRRKIDTVDRDVGNFTASVEIRLPSVNRKLASHIETPVTNVLLVFCIEIVRMDVVPETVENECR